ncbi:MAG: hypothetical protein IMW89_16145 [Ktedonobacteraceae bacterium]|nr:hypothetical protein [Ktedonobacteraceae bacterium]
MQHEARRRMSVELLHSLANRASRWYEQHALFDDAIEAALTAGDTERASRLIIHLVENQSFYQITEFYTLSRWLQCLSEETIQRSPTLCQAYALALLFSTEQHTPALRTRLEHYLRIAEERLRATNNRQKLGEVLALHALAAGQLNDQATSISTARQALALLPADEKDWRSSCLLIIGMQNMLSGRLKEAQQATRTALTLIESSSNSYVIRAAHLTQGMINLGQGKLHQAAEILRQILDTVGEDRFDRAITLTGLAALSYEWNQLTTAEKSAQEAYDISRELGNELLQVLATTILARTLYAQGETAQAQELLQRLTVHLTQPQWQREIEIWQRWFASASGDTTPLQQQASAQQADLADTSEEILTEAQREREALLLARLLIAQRRIQEALTILAHWRGQARDQLRTRSELEILLLTARAYFIEHRTQEAQQVIEEALALARPVGYLRPFLDEGEQMAALLKAALPTVREKPLAAFFAETTPRIYT